MRQFIHGSGASAHGGWDPQTGVPNHKLLDRPREWQYVLTLSMNASKPCLSTCAYRWMISSIIVVRVRCFNMQDLLRFISAESLSGLGNPGYGLNRKKLWPRFLNIL